MATRVLVLPNIVTYDNSVKPPIEYREPNLFSVEVESAVVKVDYRDVSKVEVTASERTLRLLAARAADYMSPEGE